MPGRGDEKFKIVKVDEKARSCLQITMGFFLISYRSLQKINHTEILKVMCKKNRVLYRYTR